MIKIVKKGYGDPELKGFLVKEFFRVCEERREDELMGNLVAISTSLDEAKDVRETMNDLTGKKYVIMPPFASSN